MRRGPLIVLKFGGSVLRCDDDLAIAVHEIYRWVRTGRRVVAVVSALEGTTAALLRRAQAHGPAPDGHATAALTATGELQSAALLGLALHRAGVPAEILDAAAAGLRAEGDPLDAAPVALDVAALRRALRLAPVVVVPGFVGRDVRGRTTLLGRGGSDLTALFIARRLGARCRLIKDVDGLHERDPARPGPRPRRYAALPWRQALSLDGPVVQPKALRLALAERFPFEVAALHAARATVVGGAGPSFSGSAPRPAPLRVVLLGPGNVGLGVYRALELLRAHVAVVSVGVRDRGRAAARGVPARLLTEAPRAVEVPCDAVVECIGGHEPARSLVLRALALGRHVVTANKALVAACGPELERAVRASGSTLRCSAAVGGSVPVLETARRLARRGGVVRVDAVLNGTTNFVLERVARGVPLEQALLEARRAGFAERDPRRDLSGRDAADKLVLLHHAITGGWIAAGGVARQGLTAARIGRALAVAPAGAVVRHVATLSLRPDGSCRAAVRLRALAPGHALARARGAGNTAVFRAPDGSRTVVGGLGAGRWPATEAVVADVLDLRRAWGRANACMAGGRFRPAGVRLHAAP